jgi:F-type H+-transporting ATPase subunit b
MRFLAFAESIQLVPDGTLFLHILIILIMVWCLNRILFKPVNRILQEREQHTRGRVREAGDIKQRIAESLSRYENSLREARAYGYRLLEQNQTEALNKRREKIGQIRTEIEEHLRQEKGLIQAQADEARQNLEVEARRIAASVSAQILGRNA